jgi:hypothetical protein
MFMDADDFSKVLKAEAGCSHLVAEVGRLCDSSQIGQAMFRYTAIVALQANFMKCLDDDFVAFASPDAALKPKDFSDFKQTQKNKIEHLSRLGADQLLKTSVNFSFITDTIFKVPITDFQSMADLKYAAVAKRCAVHVNAVPHLPWERWLRDDAGQWLASTEAEEASCVPLEDLRRYTAARKMVLKWCPESQATSLVEVQRIVTSKSAALKELDPTFVLEIEYLKQAATSDTTNKVQGDVVAILPDSSRRVTMPQASQKLDEFRQSRLCQISSLQVQGEVDAVIAILKNMMRGLSPDPAVRLASPFFTRVLAALAFFNEYVPEGQEDGKAAGVVYGGDAIADKLAALQALPKEKTITLRDLETFESFKWLLDEKQRAVVGQMRKECLRKLGPEAVITGSGCQPATTSASASSGSKAASSKSASSKAANSSSSSVLKFFG